MCTERWVRGPVGIDADRRVTRSGCRTVLVMVPNMVTGTRLLDVAALLARDHRIQMMFTVPEATDVWPGTDEFVRANGRMVLPWSQVLRSHFDLVLAASYTELDRVHGDVLVLPHGASSLMSRAFSRNAGPDALPHTGLARETLTRRGRVIPSVVALTHDRELVALRESCPEALPMAVVAGDICLDRMLTSLTLRDEYRRRLGVASGQRLVTVSSTWSTESVFGRHPELCARLLAELPSDDYRVALVLHPSAWSVHSPWQIRAWMADCLRDGLLVLPPEEGWRATVIASDYVIGDHGSTTQYAAAIGIPVLVSAAPDLRVRTGSLADVLAGAVPAFDQNRPALPQLADAEHRRADGLADLISSRPGSAAAILRRAAYRLLRLPEPDVPAVATPIPLPHPIRP